MATSHELIPPPAPQPAVRNRLGPPSPPKWVQLAAVILGVGPLYAYTFYSGLVALDTGKFTLGLNELLGGLAVMASFAIFLVSLLLLLGERPSDLQLQRSTLWKDVRSGVGLLFGILGALILLRIITTALENLQLVPPTSEVPESNLELIAGVAKDPLLFALFLGPVIWFQAAVVEEFTRVFVLSRLWKVWPTRNARLWSVLIWSALFGLAHVYQGATGVLGTALIGLVLGLHYCRYGRVLPLMIAHGLYDTIATLALLYAVQHPELLKPAL